mmetsp:Transcript_588/g.975  ORF Transcript_588/g.975 Transcript_588/m.975 type:complete len:146 (+) Transcript_588:794-1231(+)
MLLRQRSDDGRICQGEVIRAPNPCQPSVDGHSAKANTVMRTSKSCHPSVDGHTARMKNNARCLKKPMLVQDQSERSHFDEWNSLGHRLVRCWVLCETARDKPWTKEHSTFAHRALTFPRTGLPQPVDIQTIPMNGELKTSIERHW